MLNYQSYEQGYSYMSLAHRLIEAREAKGLTQGELGKIVGVTQQTIQSIEAGKTLQPRAIKKIADVLGVDVTWLQFGKRPPKNNIEPGIANIHQIEYKLLRVLNDNDIIDLSQTGHFKSNYERTVTVMEKDLKITDSMLGYEITNDAMVHPSNADISLSCGEIAIIDKAVKPETGDVVLALISQGNVKLRQFMQEGTDRWLRAYNSEYARIDINDETKIMGTLRGVHRVRVFKPSANIREG